ncbi:MAG: NAD(P)-binding domain-containing protein [Nannocystaceae bacterium]|nr:NAD(P)-binding domain-containing protein [Nannocystaceae bacterium]
MTTTHETHYLILGAGPAGLQSAYFLDKAGRDYLVLEASDQVGAFFSKFPRHRTLLSINKRYTGHDDPEYNLRHDWNSLVSDDPELRVTNRTQEYFPSADVLVQYLGEYAERFALRVRLQQRVNTVSRDPETGAFRLECASGDVYVCKVLIVATGIGRPRIPDVPGIELATGYESMSVDADDYRNQSVLILGKGNSAFETADNLIPTAAMIHLISPGPLRLAWESRFVGDLRAINNSFLDTYHLKSQNASIDGVIHEMARSDSGKIRVSFSSIHVENEIEQIEYDVVLRCTGFCFDDRIFDPSCAPETTLNGRFPALTPGFESVNVPDMYFMGATTQSLDYKKSQSAFIHGFRYNAVALAQLLEERYESTPLPYEPIDPSPGGLTKSIFKRMNVTSSLWQQVGFLADLVVMPGDGETMARYYHDLPYAYLRMHGARISEGRDFYITMFRLGHAPEDAFNHERNANPFEGESSTAIHPVYEFYQPTGSDGESPTSTFHVLEDFFGDRSASEYIETSTLYFESSNQSHPVPVRQLEQARLMARDQNMRLVDEDARQRRAARLREVTAAANQPRDAE